MDHGGATHRAGLGRDLVGCIGTGPAAPWVYAMHPLETGAWIAESGRLPASSPSAVGTACGVRP